MKIDTYIDRMIGETLLAQNQTERAGHISSGKLSASMLGQPLQWQILKIKGIPERKLDEYVVRKFQRGKAVEEWLVDFLKPLETQVFVEYRDCVGYIDAVVDTAEWDFKNGRMPVEIKSVANAKYKRITTQQGPDKSHILQAALYAMAVNSEHFAIAYVAADDLRVQTYILETAHYKQEVDSAIDNFQKQLATGEVPIFGAKEKWQDNKKYNPFPEWVGLTQADINIKLKEHENSN